MYLNRYANLNELCLNGNDLGAIHGHYSRDFWHYLISSCTFSGNRIKRLGLADNNFNSKAGSHLAAILRSTNCILEELDLGLNALQDQGLLNLLEGVEANCTLLKLDLSMAGIRGRSLPVLARHVSSKTCAIESLTLDNNPMANTDWTPLACALETNKSLRELSLSGCGIFGRSLLGLVKAAQANPGLAEFTFN